MFKFLFFILLFQNFLLANSKLVHVIVALCDNETQGIVKVGKKIGDGNKPNENLYWGASYGIKSYFKSSKNWNLLKSEKDLNSIILERLLFKHKNTNTYLIAEAYRGSEIKKALEDYFRYTLEKYPQNQYLKENNLYDSQKLIVYIGHNGLMDFSIEQNFNFSERKQSIALACFSKKYFKKFIKENTEPILFTNGLLAPEAYILESTLETWIYSSKKDSIHLSAAKAYAKYQKCSLKAAKNLFSTNLD
jgi:hypothetical protein